MGKASTRAQNTYIEKSYDRINLVVLKGQKETIKQSAEQAGQSVNEYICSALTAYGCPVSSKRTE